MSGWAGILGAAAAMWLAAVLDQALGGRMAIAGVRPDLMLAALGPLALLSRPAGGAALGFASGILQGALAGANLAHCVASRVAAGWLISGTGGLGIRPGAMLAFASGATGTIVARLCLMLLAPPPSLLPYLGATIGVAAYNGVLAIPVDAVLRRLYRPRAA